MFIVIKIGRKQRLINKNNEINKILVIPIKGSKKKWIVKERVTEDDSIKEHINWNSLTKDLNIKAKLQIINIIKINRNKRFRK